jgi:hypothetical protein
VDHVAALALYEHGESYVSKVPSTLGVSEKDIPVTKDDITSLANLLDAEMARSHAHVVLSQPQSSASNHVQDVRSFHTQV